MRRPWRAWAKGTHYRLKLGRHPHRPELNVDRCSCVVTGIVVGPGAPITGRPAKGTRPTGQGTRWSANLTVGRRPALECGL